MGVVVGVDVRGNDTSEGNDNVDLNRRGKRRPNDRVAEDEALRPVSAITHGTA
jgi:hypothetical protein